MTSPIYDWNLYQAIENGESLFSRRNNAFQNAVADAASVLQGKVNALEFGTGKGFTTAIFLKKYPYMNLVCVDSDLKALKTAQQAHEEYGFRAAHINQDFLTMAQNGLFDLVFGAFVTHNFPDTTKLKFFRQAHGMLKPGGYILIGDVMTTLDEKLNAELWKKDYEMLEELPAAERDWWKNHFDETDTIYSSPAEKNQQMIQNLWGQNSTGFKSAEITYRDGFWTVVRAQK